MITVEHMLKHTNHEACVAEVFQSTNAFVVNLRFTITTSKPCQQNKEQKMRTNILNLIYYAIYLEFVVVMSKKTVAILRPPGKKQKQQMALQSTAVCLDIEMIKLK
jgi:hypothetical protein